MENNNGRPGPSAATAPPAETLTCTYCTGTDELVVAIGRTGAGIEQGLGQGLFVCFDRTDGRFLDLRLQRVREHLGATRPDAVEMVVPDGTTDRGLVRKVEQVAREREQSVGELIQLIIRATGLRIRP